MSAELRPDDLERLRERGISPEEVERQLALLTGERSYTRLDRPCTVGDGIHRIESDRVDRLLAVQTEAAEEGRFSKFVPASGAATRMFRDLAVCATPERRDEDLDRVRRRADRGDDPSRAVLRFLDELERFPFYPALSAVLDERGEDPKKLVDAGRFGPILSALLDPEGLGYATAPKALLPFHRYPEEIRTSFEEHLVETPAYARDATGATRIHFTVSPEHRRGFERLLADIRGRFEGRYATRYGIDYSSQKPSTDTVAVDGDGALFRDASGELVLRPAGHGALIENLDEIDGDLVYVKNIDNIQPDRTKPLVSHWKRLLGGYLVELQTRTRRMLEKLRDRSYREHLDGAASFAASRLHVDLDGHLRRGPDAARDHLIDRLSRPIRVCGVVPNTGEPGGGPFWVRDRDGGVSLQLVETAQVDTADASQREAIAGATHFSPVDLVCTLKDPGGRPFDLGRFIDHDAVIVADKSADDGRKLRALERPGLWNGAMAGWNTVFVEVPLETFTPVKTVFDFLRPEHRVTEG
jgi:hypothetical protein